MANVFRELGYLIGYIEEMGHQVDIGTFTAEHALARIREKVNEASIRLGP